MNELSVYEKKVIWKMSKKIISFLFLILICSISCCFVTSCSEPDLGIDFVVEEEKEGPQFLEGNDYNIYVNENIVINQYVDIVKDSTYKITITDASGNVEDITKAYVWCPTQLGQYTMTYIVDSGASKGTASIVLNVINRELTWSYTPQKKVYKIGEVLEFEQYFLDLNWEASLRACVVKMDSVEIDGVMIDLSNETEFEFNSLSNHIFKFHVEASDGQMKEGSETISIKYIEAAYEAQLQNMGISYEGELIVSNTDGNKFTLNSGSYRNGNDVWLRRSNGPHDVPYLAYNGNYGVNDYLMLDFTGNNMPILSFFRDKYSKNMFDGSKGIVATGGFTNNSGKPIQPITCSNYMVYGPYMMNEYDRPAEDTTMLGTAHGTPELPYPGSLNSLTEGTRYRIIAGFSNVRLGKVNKLGTDILMDSICLDFNCLIINLDTMEVFSKFTITTYYLQALGFEEIPLDIVNNQFLSGNIVLYGKHGDETVFDCLYPIITDMSWDEINAQYATCSTFKDDVKTTIQAGKTINVADYADISNENYIFLVKDSDGNKVEFSGTSFSLDLGSYVFCYSDGVNCSASLEVSVVDFDESTWDWINENNVNIFGLDSLSDAGCAVSLKQGVCSDEYPSMASGTNSLSYIGFNGDYSSNDFVVLEFTGKNIPMISFFNKTISSNPCDGGFGLSVNFAKYSKNTGDQIFVQGPYKIFHFESEGDLKDTTSSSRLLRFKNDDGTPYQGSQSSLLDNVKYGMIVGFTSVGRTNTVLRIYIFELESKKVVMDVEQPLQYQIEAYTHAGNNYRYQNITDADFSGKITVYGYYDSQILFDKVYGVMQDTSVEEILANTFKLYASEFKSGALNVTTINTTLNVDDFVDTSNANYVFYYVDEKGNKTDVLGTSFSFEKEGYYTLYYNSGNGLFGTKEIYVDGLVNGYRAHNVVESNGIITLKSDEDIFGANYVGPNDNDVINQSYLSLGDNYSFDDYAVFEFTGKNMPEIAFFAQNYNDSMYYQYGGKKGIVVANGITLYNGTTNYVLSQNTSVVITGPYMIYSLEGVCSDDGHGGMLAGIIRDSKLARDNLQDGVQYRIIIGFSYKSESMITLNYHLYNLTDNVLVEEMRVDTYGVFDNSDPAFFDEKASSLFGAIVLYGKFGTDCVIDKLYGVEHGEYDEIVSKYYH